MPRRITLPPNEFGLKNEQFNTRIASAMLKHASVLEYFQNDLALYKYKNKILLVDKYNIRTLYYLRYKISYISYLNEHVSTAVLHWKNRYQYLVGLSDIAYLVFFKYLLPNTGIVMTDNLHTEPGEIFWLKLIDKSIEKGYYVYNLNLLPVDKDNNRELIQISDMNDVLHLGNNEDRRVLISLKPLKKQS